MTTTTTSAALVPAGPVFSEPERHALAGFLAGYSGLTAGDDQQVLVNPADLRARQASQKGRDGCAQLLRRVEGQRRVVAPPGLIPEPPGPGRARGLENLCCRHSEPPGPPGRVPRHGLPVHA